MPQPATVMPQPATVMPQPATVKATARNCHATARNCQSHSPQLSKPQPATVMPQPATVMPQPATVMPQPATVIPQPATVKAAARNCQSRSPQLSCHSPQLSKPQPAKQSHSFFKMGKRNLREKQTLHLSFCFPAHSAALLSPLTVVMSGRLTLFAFTFQITNDDRIPEEGVVERVENEVMQQIAREEKEPSTSSGSTSSSSMSMNNVLDMVVRVSFLMFFWDGNVRMRKHVELEAALSEKLRSLLQRVVAKSLTLCKKKFHGGRFYKARNRSFEEFVELECGIFGEHYVNNVTQGGDEVLLVFDMCDYIKRPERPGARWTVSVDKASAER